MATPTYADLVGAKATSGSIKNWINQDNIPSEFILSEAETEIWRRLRVREMLARTAGTIALGDSSIPLPTRFAGSKLLRRTGVNACMMTPRRIEDIEALTEYTSAGLVSSGPPRFYGADATTLQFGILADQAYTYSLLFFQSPAALSVSATTNILTDVYPRILRPMCMALANEFLKQDVERRYWLQVAGDAIDEANRATDSDVLDQDVRVEVQ